MHLRRDAARFGLGSAAIGILLAAIAGAVFAHDPADTLADRFARETERAAAGERGEAHALEQRAPADAARHPTAPKALASEQATRPTSARASAQGISAAEEDEILERARREAAAMQAAEEARVLLEEANAAQRLKAELEAAKALEERARTLARSRDDALAAQRASAAAGEPSPDAAAALPGQRAEETRRLADKLRRVRQIHAARRVEQAERQAAEAEAAPPRRELAGAAPEASRAPSDGEAIAQGPKEAAVRGADGPRAPAGLGGIRELAVLREPARAWPPAPPEPRAEVPLESRLTSRAPDPAAPTPRPFSTPLSAPGRVSVLLALTPGSYGIRRHNPGTADPVLCTLEGCYVSAGADAPALFLRGHKALGFANTWGLRAGACRQSLRCVFRGVELAEVPAFLQPVDLHILHHDRRRGQVIGSDSACGIRSGALTCERGIATPEYRLWVVPERIAAEAGPAALEQALADGLEGTRAADLSLGR
jgi:hypothetical protein